jgi:hypothetical protein
MNITYYSFKIIRLSKILLCELEAILHKIKAGKGGGMSSFKYSFYFKLHYETQFGECVFLVGNIRALGGWEISKAFRLEWNEVKKMKKFKKTFSGFSNLL